LAGPFEFLEDRCIGAKNIIPLFQARKPPFTQILGLAFPATAPDFPDYALGIGLPGKFGIQTRTLQHLHHASFGCTCLVFQKPRNERGGNSYQDYSYADIEHGSNTTYRFLSI
jgi:hypothetical protein